MAKKELKIKDINTANIEDIISTFKDSNLSKLKLKNGEIEIELELPVAGVAVTSVASPASATPATNEDDGVGTKVTSPLVGTYYGSPAPGKPKFVEVGKSVKEGDTLCIIEAMKVMNEIKAPVSGKITKIHVQEAEMVEYDKVLVTIE